MISCSKAQELLIKQTVDALEEPESLAVQAHLEICPECRLEKEQLHGLLNRAREQTRPKRLNRAEAEGLMDAVTARLAQDSRPAKATPRLLKRPMILIPAAAACASLAAALILTFQVNRTNVHDGISLKQSAQLQEPDLEVIQNLDLLQDLETIQKLVSITHDEQSDTSKSHSRVRPDFDENPILA